MCVSPDTSPAAANLNPASLIPGTSIWKSTEPLHMCNICDVKFSEVGLLNLHKAQDHGLRLQAARADTDTKVIYLPSIHIGAYLVHIGNGNTPPL